MGDASVTVLDVAILVATLAVAVGVGLAVGRRAKSARAYVVGERDLPLWAVLVSIVATETSAVTFLSVPGKSYDGDLRFLQIPLGYIVGRVAVAALLLPRYFEGDSLTAYEVLGRRFGDGVKRLTSALFLVTRSLADGLRLFLTSVALQKLSGWTLIESVTAISLVTVVYTFVGGMKAVVWTDVVQFFIYLVGGILALLVASRDVGGGDAARGLHAIVDHAAQAGKLRWLDFTPTLASGNVFWVGLVGGAFLTLATHGADQMMVQRYLSARSRRQAAIALVSSAFVVFVQFAFFLLIGLALWQWFGAHPAASPIEKGDDVFPQFIVQRLARIPGAVGVILGALFAVSMSSLSSSLNASALALVNDFLKPTVGRAWDDARVLKITKWSTLVFAVVHGVCAVVGGLFVRSVVDQVLNIASFTTGVTLGLFFLARISPRASGRAAFVGAIVGLALLLALWKWTSLAGLWYSCVGAGVTCLVGVALTPPLRSE